MWNYTEKVMDHFLRPRNVGEIPDADAVGEVGNITCGDALKLYLKLDGGKERIEDIKFQTFGCASAIASASALTELVMGKSVAEAEGVTNQDIAHFLGELPEEKMHCSVMGMEALQAALANLRGEGNGTCTVGDHDADEDYDPHGLDRIVCYCFGVTERKVREIAKANRLVDVDAITNYCKAGGGCGGCRQDLESILKDVREQTPLEEPAVQASPAGAKMTNIQKMMKVQQAIQEDIRPGLQADGGDIELIDIDGDRVIVELRGSCAGCPSAHITLKRWVEAKLRECVAPDLVVEGTGG